MAVERIGVLQTERLEPCAFVRTNPFEYGNYRVYYPQGATLSEIIAAAKINPLYEPIVFLGDQVIFPWAHEFVRPKPGAQVHIAVLPKGGVKKVFKKVAKFAIPLAIAFAAPYLTGALLGSGIIASTQLGAFALTTLVRTGVSLALNSVGSLLTNAVAPPAKPKLSPISNNIGAISTAPTQNITKESQTYFIQGATNRETPGGPIPLLFGTHRMVPPLAAQNYTRAIGDKVFATQLFCLGFGKMTIASEKLGETDLSSYTGVTGETILDGNSTGTLTLYPSVVNQNDLSRDLTSAASWLEETTIQDCDKFEVQLVWPGGLVRFDNQNNKQSQSVSYEIRYAPTGTTDWVTSSYTASQAQTSAYIKVHSFAVTRGQYDVQVRRTTGDSTDVLIRDEVTWSAIRSFKNDNPVRKNGLCLKALDIQGSDQLNGAPDQYNLVGTQTGFYDWDTDTQTWIMRATQNPASAYRYLLQGAAGKTTIPDSQIDLVTLQEWHEWCDEKGFTYNAYIDYQTDRETLLREVAAAGLASPVLVNNKYSVVIDKEKPDIVQAITPRNSFDYAFEKVFREYPHAFKVTFLNEAKGYFQDTIIVYDDGYDANNATRFEEIDFPGVTNADHVWKLARHRMAEMRLRPVVHTVTMDVENIVCTKGDRVRLTHDVALLGLGSGRITAIGSGSITTDETFTIEAGKTYGIRIRKADNTQVAVTLTNSTATNTNVLTMTSVPSGVAVGDLVMFGEDGSESIDCIVQGILPQGDSLATLRLVDYSPAIFTASTGTIPAYDNQITLPSEFRRPIAPILVSVITDEAAQIVNMDGSITNRMVITLQNTNGYPVQPLVRIRRVGDDDYQAADIVSASDSKVVIEGLQQGAIYDMSIRYRRLVGSILSNNVSEEILVNQVTFLGTSAPPPDVENFDITVRSDSVFLSWDKINVIDLAGYEIRFSTALTGAEWGSAITIDAAIPSNATSYTATSRIGTYMIKAFDRQGNYSENETLAVTTIGQLDGLNQVEIVEEHLTWGGVFDGTTVDGGNLQLGGTQLIDDYALIDDITFWDYGSEGIASGGIYYFENPVDLGAVYTSVLSGSLAVSGANVFDLIDEWDFIDGRTDWDGTSPDQYSVRLQVRTTDDNPAGSPVTWGAWKDLLIGEYTARGFEFRLVLVALVADVTPIVSNATVTIDAPDRFESGDDIASGTGGYNVNYANSFAPLSNPAIAISADNMATSDYYTITSKDNTGFTIEFFNSGATSVNRTFSYVARGYGRQN